MERNREHELPFSVAFLAPSLSEILRAVIALAGLFLWVCPSRSFLFLKSSEAKIRVMHSFPKQKYYSELLKKTQNPEVGKWIKIRQNEGWGSVVVLQPTRSFSWDSTSLR